MIQTGASPDPFFAVLIPAHNEAGTIREIVNSALNHCPWVIVIDDGSTDGTSSALNGLPVEIIRHEFNAGKGQRLAEGLAHAVGKGAAAILTMDADGQHDPEDIPAFLSDARANPSAIVLGDRMGAGTRMPTHRVFSIAVGDFAISWATARRLRDCQCGMRVYPAKAADIELHGWERQKFAYETAILLHAAENGISFIRTPIAARYAGFQRRPSHFRPTCDTLLIARVITLFLLRRFLRPKGLLIALGLLR